MLGVRDNQITGEDFCILRLFAYFANEIDWAKIFIPFLLNFRTKSTFSGFLSTMDPSRGQRSRFRVCPNGAILFNANFAKKFRSV